MTANSFMTISMAGNPIEYHHGEMVAFPECRNPADPDLGFQGRRLLNRRRKRSADLQGRHRQEKAHHALTRIRRRCDGHRHRRACPADTRREDLRGAFRKAVPWQLSFDIEQIPGWRRLPGKAGDYSSKTTDSHRDLFVAAFKLYPEIDFHKFDYIVANMPKVGNTAFGEREDIAIPHRGGKIKVALNLSSPSPFVLAHGCGHLMGLPDLYTYADCPGPENQTGPWDLMSEAGKSSGFLGWQRHKLKWLDTNRKTYLTVENVKLTLTPLDATSGIPMIAIPVDDPKQPSKVFAIEVAQQPRLP